MVPQSATEAFARLRAEAQALPTIPYLVTVTGDLRPHCSVVTVDWDHAPDRLVVAAPGNWAGSQEAGHTAVTLLWPPADPGGYSLIVDGPATTIGTGPGQRLAVTPSRAVFHRPERVDRPGAPCGADCVQIIPS